MPVRVKAKRSFWKRWWVWAIVVLFVVVVAVSNWGEEKMVEPDEIKDMEENEREIAEAEMEAIVTEDIASEIEETLVSDFEKKKESGFNLNLHKLEYDAYKIEVWINYKFVPETTVYVSDQGERAIIYITEEILGEEAENVDITVTNVSKIGEGEFIHWGTNYYQEGIHTFRIGPGAALLN